MVLGARTILAYALHALDDEADHDRLVALLAAAYRGQVDVATPARVAKALTLWRRGEKAMAAIHLALARLPPIELDDAYRPHLANLALDGGVATETLLRAFGHAEVTARLLKHSQAEPRVPAGGGPHGGEWTSEGGAEGGAASGHDAATQLAANTTTKSSYACKRLKIDAIQAGDAIRAAKDGRSGAADQRTFDLITGEIIFQGVVIENLKD